MALFQIKKSPEHTAALDRVREWVRARFSLGEGAILVAEVACAVPGCPPIETVIAFWSERGGTTSRCSSRWPR